MSRNAAARELQEVIEQAQLLLERGHRLALASGGLVRPENFGGARAAMAMAAGGLDQKGLWLHPAKDTPA